MLCAGIARGNAYHRAVGPVNRAGLTQQHRRRLAAMQPFETVYVDKLVVACDGTSTGGHPRVFLNLATAGQIECPYCSRLFVLKGTGDGKPPAAAAHP
jgi:uncharacterized Zn-finger protein